MNSKYERFLIQQRIAEEEAAASTMLQPMVICNIWLNGIHMPFSTDCWKLVWFAPEQIFVAGRFASEYPFINSGLLKFKNSMEVLIATEPICRYYVKEKLRKVGK